jgi:hypothetical protein
MSLIKDLFHVLFGFRKFIMGIIGLTILIVSNLIVLTLFLKTLLTGDQFISFAIESCKVVGIIVAAFMAINMLAKVVEGTKQWLKTKK